MNTASIGCLSFFDCRTNAQMKAAHILVAYLAHKTTFFFCNHFQTDMDMEKV